MGIFDTMMGLFEEYEKCYIIAQELQILKILLLLSLEFFKKID